MPQALPLSFCALLEDSACQVGHFPVHLGVTHSRDPASHGVAGTKLPTGVSQSLQSGSYSPALDSWLEGLPLPTADAADLDTHVKLLAACNTCLDQVGVIGSEQALQLLGSSCCSAMRSAATGAAGAVQGSPKVPTPSCKPVAQLTADLVAELAGSCCQLPEVLKALQAGVDGTTVSFPKYRKLVEFLAQMKVNKSRWHGMVFVKTRAGVHALTHLLQRTAGLEGVTFSPLTGHGKTTAGVAEGTRGMNIKRQSETVDSFRAAQGMSVLVATAAAEEGIDIPNCEFAVSYTVVESGREWTQRQGRARMPDSQFVSIVERGTNDRVKLDKSRQEAFNEYAAVMQPHFIV